MVRYFNPFIQNLRNTTHGLTASRRQSKQDYLQSIQPVVVEPHRAQSCLVQASDNSFLARIVPVPHSVYGKSAGFASLLSHLQKQVKDRIRPSSLLIIGPSGRYVIVLFDCNALSFPIYSTVPVP